MQDSWEFGGTTHATAIRSPDFDVALHKMNLGDMSWLPELPPKYLKAAPAPSPASDDSQVKKTTPVPNRNKNELFDEFKEAIGKIKFNDAIKKVGDPPTVKRGGKEVPMCASCHLRGSCFSNCSCRADHGPHSQAKDAKLHEWCKLAFVE